MLGSIDRYLTVERELRRKVLGTLGATLTQAAGLALSLSYLVGITLARCFVESRGHPGALNASATVASWNSGALGLQAWDKDQGDTNEAGAGSKQVNKTATQESR